MAFAPIARAAAVSVALALLASFSRFAHAELLLTFADGPVTVIRGASLYRASKGTRLHNADIVETDTGRSAQVESDAGTLIALGPQTRILLNETGARPRDASTALRVSLLTGWLKMSRVVGAPAPTALTLSVEMPQVIAKPADGAAGSPWSIVAMAGQQRIASFAEAGDVALAIANAGAGKAASATLRAGQYGEHSPGSPLRILARPSAEFIAQMPVAFRDSLVAVSGRLRGSRELPPPLRAVDYADVSDWLASDLSARGTFLARFRPRLKAAEFRAQVDAHLDALPEWRPVLHPPPPQAPPRPQPEAGVRYSDKPTPRDRGREDKH